MTTVTKVRKLVRPFVAVALTLTVVALFAAGKIESREILPIFAVIVGFYFGERSALKKPDISESEPE